MYLLNLILLLSIISNIFCVHSQDVCNSKYIDPRGKTIAQRILVPEGFVRMPYDSGSFSFYLRQLSLKKHGSPVLYYNGEINANSFHCAVVDISVGNKDLQQCADAVIRLRAEYLYYHKRYQEICFHFTNGFLAEYIKWMEGNRIKTDHNKVTWVKTAEKNDSYENFLKFLETVFTYSGTLSLSKEIKLQDISALKPGDVFIRGGNPGHAVIVVDMAKSIHSGERIFLIAQSFMPAQDIHLLINPVDSSISPWYKIDTESPFITPEWTFETDEIRKFD